MLPLSGGTYVHFTLGYSDWLGSYITFIMLLLLLFLLGVTVFTDSYNDSELGHWNLFLKNH